MIKTYARRKLGVRPAHRRMMLRQLATHLVQHERITTTTPRAKELKAYVERMISTLKNLDNPALLARATSRWLAPNGLKAEKKFRDTVLPRYKARNGGYLRVLALPPRFCDQAKLSRIEFLS
ncbi:MAG: 50S ribosomal protein L17 [Elusimicrobia bacterium]|nr:50S ribosomal protein L17 [Elusimicrobiota bacterium]